MCRYDTITYNRYISLGKIFKACRKAETEKKVSDFIKVLEKEGAYEGDITASFKLRNALGQ